MPSKPSLSTEWHGRPARDLPCGRGRFSGPVILRSRKSPSRHRGSSEIELMLIITVLMTLLFLVLGVLRIGLARQDMVQSSGFQAFRNATSEALPKDDDDPDQPIEEGYIPLRPGLPNRVSVPRNQQEVTVFTAESERPTFKATVGGEAAVASPPWNYTAHPVGANDEALNQQWFQDWIDESHSAFSSSLGLAPAWAP